MTASTASRALIAVIWAALGGCGSSKHEAPGGGQGHAAPIRATLAFDAAPARVDAGPPVGETAARVVLARMFREAGLRIRHDVRVTGDKYDVTLDGYDPRRRVGFEYIDSRERGTDFDRSERDAMARAGLRVLVIDGGSSGADVIARATRFLEQVRARARDAGA